MADLDLPALGHVAAAGEWAAGQLRSEHLARVHLTPGDMTRYDIVVVGPWREWWASAEPWGLGSEYWVALINCEGHGYPWNRQWVHPSYAAEKWTCPRQPAGTRAHTGEVMAAFLNALAAALDRLTPTTQETP
jgi:hypothetical protein